MGTSSGTLFHILGDDGEKGYRLLCSRPMDICQLTGSQFAT
jgi:hypothetical protein